MKRAEVVQVYKSIRKEFFPRWDKEKEWTIRLRKDLPSTGLCSLERKYIDIQLKSAIEMPLSLFFVHEISHVVTKAGHNKKWMDRMMKAAETADRLYKALGQGIRENITSYKPGNCEVMTVGSICNQIEDCVLGIEREISFPKVINWNARSCGLYPQEFKRHYRKSMGRFRKVFDEARDLKMRVQKQRTENGIVTP